MLHRVLKKAIGGDQKAIVYLLEQFLKYDAITLPEVEQTSGVLVLPSDRLPWPMCVLMLQVFGKPPWDEKQLNWMRPKYKRTAANSSASRMKR